MNPPVPATGRLRIGNTLAGHNVSARGIAPINREITADDLRQGKLGLGLTYRPNDKRGLLRTKAERVASDRTLYSRGLQTNYATASGPQDAM